MNGAGNSFSLKNVLHQSDMKKRYQLPPSLLKHLPWAEFDEIYQAVLLQDESVGTVYELEGIAVNAKGEDFLTDFRDSLQALFQDVFTLYHREESPWILQFYFQKESLLKTLYSDIENYVQSGFSSTKYTKSFLSLTQKHCDWMSNADGVFIDDKVSGNIYRGGIFKIRMVIYRKPTKRFRLQKGRSLLKDLNVTCSRLEAKFKEIGINAIRYNLSQFTEWMIKWFNPNPAVTNGNTDALLNLIRDNVHLKDDEKPFGYDFSEQLFFSIPESNQEKGTWYFDNEPHRYINIQELKQIPKIGHLSHERNFGNNQYALIDKIPEKSIFVMTVILQSQEVIKNHLARIEKNAQKSGSTAALITFEDCQVAKDSIERGNYLFPVTMGVYLHGKTDGDLLEKQIQTEALLINNGFQVLHGDYDLLPIHSYLNQLPMCYDYTHDQMHLYRSGYVFAKQIANLIPLYGRERGTGNPGIVFYNRGGEPLVIDPLSPKDKDNNSYLLLLGAAGSGKSSTSAYLMMQAMAIYRPRLVIIDAGNSFKLLSGYFEEEGLSVYRVDINLIDPPILNPFVNSSEMLQQLRKAGVNQNNSINQLVENFEEESKSFKENENGDDIPRDYMGEMIIACQLMITGGEKKEIESITRQERLYIVEALIKAAKHAEKNGFSQMIASDVVLAFREIAAELQGNQNEINKVARLKKMADSLDFFCQDALSSQVFNRRGEDWPDADVTLFEQGIFKGEGYEAQNALAYMSLMSRVMGKAEKLQYEERQTIVFADEVHTLLKIPLTALYLTKCAKMSRKLGLWLWLATQNIGDFTGDAQKILSMVEFWICLGLSEAEIKALEQYRVLTDEERTLFRSVRKAAKKYVEGVLLCPRLKTLFRNIPPRYCLALAMTEKQEKAERMGLMRNYNISELAAALMIAERMMDNKFMSNTRGFDEAA